MGVKSYPALHNHGLAEGFAGSRGPLNHAYEISKLEFHRLSLPRIQSLGEELELILVLREICAALWNPVHLYQLLHLDLLDILLNRHLLFLMHLV